MAELAAIIAEPDPNALDVQGMPASRLRIPQRPDQLPAGKAYRQDGTSNVHGDDGMSLSDLIANFEESEQGTQSSRERAERDRDYYDGKQWTDSEISTLNRRGQPALVINRVQRKIDYLRGMERRTRTDPKAWPRTPQHEDDAESVTDALRFVADQNTFDVTASEVFEDELIEGYGGCEVTCDTTANPPRVTIEHIPWDRIFVDPHSRLRDFSDAKYKGIVIWMDRRDAEAMFPGREDAIQTTLSASSGSFEDRPKDTMWADNRRTRLRIVQMYYQQPGGQWFVCTFTRGGHLTDPQPSPWQDEHGNPECPLVLQSAYVDRQNNRYGVVRAMISLQDEINKRRSKALHLLSVRTVVAEKGAVENVDNARRELAKPDGYVEITPSMKFEVQQNAEFTAGQMGLLTHATQEMDLTGPNASMAGKDQRDQSGRAIIAQQQGGAIEVEPLNDGHRQWKRRVFTQVWHRVRQFWTGEVWVRVTDDERNLRWVGINRPVKLGDKLGQMPQEMQAAYMSRNGFGPNDPRLQDVVGVENQIAQLDVDVQVEEGPDIATIAGEQFQQLTDMVRAGMQIPPDIIIQASSLRNKDALLERMQAQSQPQQDPLQNEMIEANRGKAHADIRKTQSEAERNEAQANATKAKTAQVLDALIRPQVPMAQPMMPGG